MKPIPALALSLTLALTSACGFHLRGAIDLPPELNSLYISDANQFSPFNQALVQTARRNGITISGNVAKSPFTLAILDQDFERRVLSVDANTRVSEYEMTETVTISIRHTNGDILLPETDITAERSYVFDENQVLSKSEEEAQLRETMRQDLVRQVLLRLRTVVKKYHANQG